MTDRPHLNLIGEILSPDRILVDSDISSKKKLLESLSQLLATELLDTSESLVFNSLLQREKIGSTGLGRGVGLPHARMSPGSPAIGAFIKLQQGIDYDASDNQPVDLVFALLVPEDCTDNHLELLSTLAQLFRNDDFCAQIRHTHDVDSILKLLTIAPKREDAK